jgi:hypothetical protein
MLLVVRSSLHGVVDFSRCSLLRRFSEILVHFSFRLKKDGTIFGAVAGFVATVHAI